jgi:hypothetical protein
MGFAAATPPFVALAQSDDGEKAAVAALETSFRSFLAEYRQEVRQRNVDYLKIVHPKLPPEQYDFFFDITLQMMRHSDENGLEPKIECREYGVCKAVYMQPGGSWAAQTFILHEGDWRWLDS